MVRSVLADAFGVLDNLGDTVEPDAAFGPDTAAGTAWFEKWRHVLRHDPGGVDRVINVMRHLLRKGKGTDDVRRELAFFRNNRRRGLRHRFGIRGVRKQGLGDVSDEAIRAELGPRRRLGRPDLLVAP